MNLIHYDVMGNINQLSRNGSALNQWHFTDNRLDRIDNVASTFVYDVNGNVTIDGGNGMALIYNQLDLPSQASGNGKVVNYLYDASGSKLHKLVLHKVALLPFANILMVLNIVGIILR